MNDKSYIVNAAVSGNAFLTKGTLHQLFSPQAILLPPREAVVDVRLGSIPLLEIECYAQAKSTRRHFVGWPQGDNHAP